MTPRENPVSIVIPLFNAERHIVSVLEAILSQDYEGDREVIVVNDGSTDRSRDLLKTFEEEGIIKVLDQPNQGAVAATNAGFNAARYGFICSVDSDAVLHRGWLRKIMEEFDDPRVGAVQGYIKTPAGLPFIARMAGYDLEYRYDQLRSKYVTQVSTTNTAYRKTAVEKAGLFDPQFTYGYDNDMSYRIQKAGYTLVFRGDAFCDHYWKADTKSYLKQQYRSAYGRMQLISKHRDKLTGDSVSGIRMIVQVPLTLAALCLILLGAVALPWGGSRFFVAAGLFLFGAVLVDRVIFALEIVRKQRDPSACFLPLVHLFRNVVWSWAFVAWGLRGAFLFL